MYSSKTQIALAFVYWVRQEYRNVSIFWVHASNAERFSQAFFQMAETCKIPGHNDPETNVLPLVKTWLEREDQGPWLMVIDNADDAEIFFGSDTATAHGWGGSLDGPAVEGMLDKFIPICSHGAVLVTTRNKQTGIKLTRGHNLVEVGPMSREESGQLIRKRLEGDDTTDAVQMSLLSSRLEHVPLAMVQAAAFIQENSLTVGKYVRLLEQGDDNLVELLSQSFHEEGIESSTPIAVTTAWIVSFTQIHKQHPCASKLLSLMSFFDRHSIPKLFLASYWQDEHHHQRHQQQRQTDPTTGTVELEKALGVLKAFSFVAESEIDESLNMHRLTQLVMRKWLITKGEAGTWGSIALSILSYLFPCGEYENWTTCRSFLPHVYAILSRLDFSSSADDILAKATLMHAAALFLLYKQQQWNKAEELQVQAVEIRTRVLGAEHPDTMNSMANLALAYINQGRWAKAVEQFTQIIATHKRILGTEHPATLVCMNNLAAIYQNQGDWAKAEEQFTQIVATQKKILGAEHPTTLMCMANLAGTYIDQGRWKEAEKLSAQVVDTRRRVLGAEHPETVMTIANLASAYRMQGQLKEAEERFIEVIEIFKRVLDAEHPYTLISIGNLAATYTNQGRYKEAESLEVHVMEMNKRLLGPEHPHTLTSIVNLASTYANQGRYKEAESLEVHVMEMNKRVRGPEHPYTLTSMENLAFTLKGQGRDEEAISLMNECVQLRERAFGLENPGTCSSRTTLNLWERQRESLRRPAFVARMVTECINRGSRLRRN